MGTKGEKTIYRNHVELIGLTGGVPKPKPPRTVARYDVLDRHQYVHKKDGKRGKAPNGTASRPGGKLGEYAAASVVSIFA